ncbi:MAG TPA: ABC transporter ATP-binding protein [Actinomycetales bacterium]|nr:ABC transporter ATP-binding protein [Actinomycetales bacterium]
MNGAATTLPVAGQAAVRAETARLLRQHRGPLALVVGLHALAALAGLAGPWLLGTLVQHVTEGTTFGEINRIAVTLAVFVLIETVFTRFAKRSALVLGEEVFAQLREEFMQRVTGLPLSTVERAGTGDLVSRTTRDVESISWSVRFAIPSVLVAAVTVALTLVAAAFAGGAVALALLAGVPLIWTSARWYLRRAPAGYLREGASYARLNGVITETVDGARTVDALGLGPWRRRHIDDALRGCFVAERYTLALRMRFYPVVETGYLLPIVVAVGWGGWLVAAGHADVGQVTAVALYAVRVVDPLSELIEWWDEIQIGAASLARMIGIAEVPPDRTTRDDATPAGQDIVARDVRYAYRPGHDVLHGIDVGLGRGERLAMVGPSGAGKSTLGRLLAGIHPPTAGTVTVGGVPLVDLPMKELHRQVALVTQEHHVFVGTLADNLRLAKAEAEDAELRGALAAVDALGWAEALPEGLQTEVGSGGTPLTPAQAQQVALARLVLADPHTLVLDEATSLLDPTAARHLERSLSAVLEGRTVVAIAHRLHTAHDADRVAVVEDGRITELGSHAELIEADGSYAALWRSWRDEPVLAHQTFGDPGDDPKVQ